jgi:hypothetical protein
MTPDKELHAKKKCKTIPVKCESSESYKKYL